MLRMFRDEALGGDHEACNRGFHVRRAATEELALAHRGNEGIGMPLAERSRRHDIGMSGKAHHGTSRAATRPEVRHPAELHRLAFESGTRKALGQELLAPGVFRGDRPAGYELLGKLEGARIRHRS